MTARRGVAKWACTLLIATAPAACLDAEDEVEMTVFLAWDQRPDAETFRGTSCTEAGVDRADWRLIRAKDGVQVAEGVDACCPAGAPCEASVDWLLISEPSPGDYTLEITGLDASDAALWGARCTGLRVMRFDRTYRCDIPSPAPP
jgi:hypothetical protein